MSSVSALTFVAQDGGKQSLQLTPGSDTTIGRHPKCTLTVSQPSVSRRHARIWCEQGQWFVEDLKSSNGTFINNDRISKGTLQEGDAIRCGDFELQYVQATNEGPKTGGQKAAKEPRVVGKLPSDQGIPNKVLNRPTVGLSEEESRQASIEAAKSASKVADLEKVAKEKTAEIAEMKEQLERWKARVATANADRETAEQELESLRAKVGEVTDELKNSASELKILAVQNKELVETQGQLESAKAQIVKLEAANNSLERKVEKLKADAAQSTEEDALNEKIGELESELKLVRSGRDSLENRAQEQASRIDELTAAVKAAERSAADAAEAQAKGDKFSGERSAGIAEASRDLSEDLDELSQELRKSIKLSGAYLADLAPVIDAAEALRKKGLPKSVSAALRNAIEDSDGAATMELAQTAIDDAGKSARGLRRIARLFRESLDEGSDED